MTSPSLINAAIAARNAALVDSTQSNPTGNEGQKFRELKEDNDQLKIKMASMISTLSGFLADSPCPFSPILLDEKHLSTVKTSDLDRKFLQAVEGLTKLKKENEACKDANKEIVKIVEAQLSPGERVKGTESEPKDVDLDPSLVKLCVSQLVDQYQTSIANNGSKSEEQIKQELPKKFFDPIVTPISNWLKSKSLSWKEKNEMYARLDLKILKKEERTKPMTSRKKNRIETAAEQKNADAQCYLGLMHIDGYAVPESLLEAQRWFLEAVQKKHARSMYCFGWISEGKKDYKEARKFYKMAVDEGYARAEWKLGCMHYAGLGVDQDYSAAKGYFTQAANKGDNEAQFKLGHMHYHGNKDVPQNNELALEWFEKAAKNGHVEAQFRIGNMFYIGFYIGEKVERNYKKAAAWLHVAAKNGHDEAQYQLGYMYVHNKGVRLDYIKAREWFRKAAEAKNKQAQFMLGKCFDGGIGGIQSDEKAIELYKQSADQGYAKAQCKLAIFYYYGRGTNQDKAEAVRRFIEAADQNLRGAQYYLGKMHEDGEGGLTKSDTEAKKWYKKAAEKEHQQAKLALQAMEESERLLTGKAPENPQVADSQEPSTSGSINGDSGS